MALLLQGNELIVTEPVGANVLAQLVRLAAHGSLIVNGLEMRAQDLEHLAEEARLTGKLIKLGAHVEHIHTPERFEPESGINPAAHKAMPSTVGFNEFRDASTHPREIPFMQEHQKKAQAHAFKSLADELHLLEPEQLAGRLRSFLKIEDHRLRIAHHLGARGAWTAAAHSFVIDLLVARVFQIAAQPALRPEEELNCAVLALGGYGRRELAPFSDIDLLFLHKSRRSPLQTKERIERTLHLLWDAGLTVGHKVHTVEECIASSRTDTHFATALVSARIVAGDEALFERLSNALEVERRKNAQRFIVAVLGEHTERQQKPGASLYLQEPNVKESVGGLRDLHTALWATHAKYNCRSLEELRAANHISETESLRAAEAYDFLLRVRRETHWLAKRKADHLTLDLQPALAARFGYSSSTYLRASEQFMRDYYRRARALHLFSETLLARAAAPEERAAGWLKKTGLKRLRRERSGEAFSIRDKQLQLETNADSFASNPMLFFQAFDFAQQAGVELSHDLREAMRGNLTGIDRNFRTSAESGRAFLDLLRRRGRVGFVLRLMHEVGFLGRYLPEVNRIRLLIQHDLYHHYTIDEHTLRAVEALDELHHSKDKTLAHLQSAFEEVEDVALVYLALLLHDLGKGRGSGHVARGVQIAERICARLQMDAGDAAKVARLVKHHISMAHVSQRRDLSEPRIVAQFAAQIENPDALNMLWLLTYADMSGVGPGVWTDWKGALLHQLYLHTRVHFAGGFSSLAGDTNLAELKHEITAALAGQFLPDVVEHHFALLPDRYARAANPKLVAAHLFLTEQLRQETIACRWFAHESMTSELLIAARGRRGLFADIAGALAAQGIEILSADLNTRADNIVIDTFVLREAASRGAVGGHRWKSIERALLAGVKGEQDVAALVERWRTRNAPRRPKALTARPPVAPTVHCDNDAAEATTLIEVHAADEPGLAYKIASALARLGLDIVYAKIATEKSDALDVFYVTNEHGIKLSEPELRAVRETLLTALSTPSERGNDSAQQHSEVIAR